MLIKLNEKQEKASSLLALHKACIAVMKVGYGSAKISFKNVYT